MKDPIMQFCDGCGFDQYFNHFRDDDGNEIWECQGCQNRLSQEKKK